MNEPCVVLKPECPFYDLFPNGMLPVQEPISQGVRLVNDFGGTEVHSCFMVDANRLTTAQGQALVEMLAEVRGGRVKDVMPEVMEFGIPIRASECAVFPYQEKGLS
jgi:hypothetical protein